MTKSTNNVTHSSTNDSTSAHCDYTLVLLCKRPALYQGKQRLAATIGPKLALTFAKHFLACALEDLNQWPGKIVISPASEFDVPWANKLLTKPALILSQQGGNLGERLNQLDQQLRQQGHTHILYIGSDAPMLNSQHFNAVCTALADADIALAPAQDGGVTIMANRQAWPPMQHLPWSTDQLGSALTALCQEHQLGTLTTDLTYDVDHQPQLAQLAQDLIEDPRPARQALLKQIVSMNLTSGCSSPSHSAQV